MQPDDVRTREDLARLFAARGYLRGCEVGVADARYSALLCATIPGVELLCVDPWEPYGLNGRGGGKQQQHGNYDVARERLAPYAATLDRRLSADAAPDVPPETLDFVYIDGNHDFDFVMLDLLLWVPKVRAGGIVAGHDYYHFRNSGVIEAVDAYAAVHGIRFHVTGERREPSWWWET